MPEVGDLTGKNRRVKQTARQNRFYAVPDSVIAGANAAGQYDTSISEDGTQSGTADSNDGTMTNFADIGKARDAVLQVRLDQAAQGSGTETSNGVSTNVDPRGYLTSLNKSSNMGEAQVGDVNRVRTLLASVIKTNPKHGPGWVAAARLEEVAGKIVAARNVIAKGCENCPKSEDCWLENIRLADKVNARIIAASAIKSNDRSVRLWQTASELETDSRSRKRVLQQAIDHVPQSIVLWKELVNLQDDVVDARLLLYKATETIPLATTLWLALARLETPDNAQKVLNKARKAVPTSYEIWVAAARLQEQMEEPTKVDMVMKRGIQSLARESAMLKREEWIEEAERCESEGAILTTNAIIRETLGWTLDEDDDRKDIWLDDAKSSIGRARFATARAIFAYALRVFPTSKTVYQAAVDLERTHGTPDNLFPLLQKATEACPNDESLWIQLAREKQSRGDLEDARRVLARAFAQNPSSEEIWLSACALEADAGEPAKARELLAVARDQAGTDRIYIKSAAFERAHGAMPADVLALLTDGLARYPRAAKLHMLKGQVYEHDYVAPQIGSAREAYAAGTRAVPSSTALWLLYSRLEEKAGLTVKARSVLERARLALPADAAVWTEAVRVERRAGNEGAAKNMLARAMQAVPTPSTGQLWAERIWHLEARNQRKSLALTAVKAVDNDPLVFVTISRLFWSERKLEKAASWFEKAVLLDPDQGDSWAWYYKFLEQHGTVEKREDVVAKVVVTGPKHGEVWQAIAKDPKNDGKAAEEILKIVVAKLT